MKTPGRMTCGLLAGFALAFLVATDAGAQAPSGQQPSPTGSWRGFYLGGGGSYSNVSVATNDEDCHDGCYWWGDYDYDEGDGAYGYSVHAGARVHPFVALEVSYLDSGTIGWDKDLVYMPEFNDYYNNHVDFSAKVTELSVLGILPFADIWELYVRLGGAWWDARSTQHLDQSFGNAVVNRSVDDNGTSMVFGVGFGVTVFKGLHLRLDFQTLGIDEDVLNARDDASLDSFLLEAQYRFGAH
jgi:hypothetical protein